MSVLCFDKICRLCLTESPLLLSIYDKYANAIDKDEETSGNISTIIDLLISITSMQIIKNDGLPEQICVNCVQEINRIIAFKIKCERSEITLKTYLQQVKGKLANVTILPDLDEITHLLKNEEILEPCDSNEMESAMEIEQEPADMSSNKGTTNNNNTDDVVYVASEVLNNGNKINDSEAISYIYECVTCSTQFQHKCDLKTHIIDNHPETHCHICDLHYSNEEMCNEHYNNEHPPSLDISEQNDELNETNANKKVHQCPHCTMNFVHNKNLKNHIEKVHPKTDVEIDSESSESDCMFDLNTNDIDSDKMMDENIVHRPKILSKVRTDDPNNFKCNKCNAGFTKERTLIMHQNSNKCTVKSFKCDVCNRVFVRRKNLKQHQLTHSNKRDYKCTECPKEFSRQDQLTLHMSAHTGFKKHKCQYCDKGFNMISSLKDHVRTHNGEKPYLCSICGRGFSQSTNLKQHTMRHTNTKPFKCTFCEYTFVSKGELNAHLRKHTGDHPFVCDICGTGFTTSSSLVKHKRIHTGERPYACDFCPMRFTALGTLKNHRRTHTGERPFACKFCNRSFTQKSDMVSHSRTHTDERPYICSYCGLSFQQTSTLKSHIKIHETASNCDSMSNESSSPSKASGTITKNHNAEKNNSANITIKNESN